MQLARILRHLFSSTRRTRRQFSAAVLAEIETAIGAAESQHEGEIRFVIESALPWKRLWRSQSPRRRALEVFAHLHVWDTRANNGVLIYVLHADRAVEIIADRGISERVTPGEWQAICHEVEMHYRDRRFEAGSRAAVAGVARLLAQHFPGQRGSGNELPNQPVLL